MYTIPYLPLQALNGRQAEEMAAVAAEVVRSGWYLRGERTAAFEAAFAHYSRRAHCVATANGMDALTLILMALKAREGWADGDEVIVPALTFVATAEAVERARLTPVFADINAHFTMSPAQAARRISPRTRALMPVHLYGAAADMAALTAMADAHGLAVIEDAAQAHGLPADNRNRGIAAAYSFYPGKNLGALGDGGAVCTDDADLARLIRCMANYGAEQKYRHEWSGLNSRMDEIQAAFLRVKLPLLDADNCRRRQIAARYAAGIRSPHVSLPYGGRTDHSVFHIYPLCTPYREALQTHLAGRGIETLIHYPLALHRQPLYAHHRSEHYPEAERVAATEISLPLHPLLTDSEADLIIESVNSFQP